MSESQACVFCRIVLGSIPAEIVHVGERVMAFRDLDPQAPVHVLVIPKEHFADVPALAAADPGALAELVRVSSVIAEREVDGEFRLVFNTGASAGQSVFHAHGHVLAGRRFTWPPG
jgi:histidine triad (HIT) family protein